MGEEVRMSDYEGGGSGGDGDEERVSEWEAGLPTADDLTPLSQPLIPAELASAFSISPEPWRTAVEVNRASQKTVSTLRGGPNSQAYSSNYKSFDENDDNNNRSDEPMVVEAAGSDSRKSRKVDSPEEADSALRIEDDPAGGGSRAVKRPRLVWTPQLHKRFVDVVAHLGIKNAVPKTIMQLMNVEGLTRENVASHLQKYRLYLKRMQGLSNEGPSSSDKLFASTPVPPSLHESGSGGGGAGHHMQLSMPMPMPMPYPPGHMMPMPPGYMGLPGGGFHHGFESHPSYSMMQQHSYGAMVSYPPHVAPNEK